MAVLIRGKTENWAANLQSNSASGGPIELVYSTVWTTLKCRQKNTAQPTGSLCHLFDREFDKKHMQKKRRNKKVRGKTFLSIFPEGLIFAAKK